MPEQAHALGVKATPVNSVPPAVCRGPLPSRVIDQFQVFDAEARQWAILEAPSMPSHDYAWLRSCAEIFAADETLACVAVGGSQPSAVAPLIKRGRLFPRLECLGVNELYEPTDFPHDDLESLEAVVREVTKLGYPLLLKRVLADSPILPALRSAIGSRGMVMAQPVSGYPWLPLDSTWVDPESKLSPSRRSAVRRSRRHAEGMGIVTFEVHAPTHLELETLLEEAYRVEASGWKGRGHSALLADRSRRIFFNRYAETIRHKSSLRLCFMRIDGRAVAMQFAVECRNRLWLLKIGYDEEFSKCSPGNLLMTETVRYAAQHGLDSIEFLGTVEPWTQIWTQSVRECVAVRAYPASARGLAGLGLDASQYVWQRLRRNRQ